MSEHWKSTPRYWCKHCSCYVRDTKLEKQNHESTAKHQGALKRFLRDLHRGHEKEEKDKERARNEVARLNGVVSGASSSTRATPQQPVSQGASSESQLKKQRDQLLELGVALPDTAPPPEVAAPGEWTVTQTRVIEPKKEGEEEDVEKIATGVRKREITEEEREEEDAVKSLFKKQRKWGRDSRIASTDEDKELDALLSGSLAPTKIEPKTEEPIKEEPKAEDEETERDVKQEDRVKEEPDDAVQGLLVPEDVPEVKTETGLGGEESAAPVFFKKRKAKGIRQR
jgi:hypothetical protein